MGVVKNNLYVDLSSTAAANRYLEKIQVRASKQHTHARQTNVVSIL
jgi:hypothetical protein